MLEIFFKDECIVLYIYLQETTSTYRYILANRCVQNKQTDQNKVFINLQCNQLNDIYFAFTNCNLLYSFSNALFVILMIIKFVDHSSTGHIVLRSASLYLL